MTVIEVDGFREPFIGYLPGLAAAAGDLGSSPWGSGIHTTQNSSQHSGVGSSTAMSPQTSGSFSPS